MQKCLSQMRQGHPVCNMRCIGSKAALRPLTARCQRRFATLVVAVASPPAPSQPITAETPAADSIRRDSVSGASPFLRLGVDPMLVAILPSIDVTRPSPIQAAALPAILSGANCAVQSYTGSGKTLSYLLPTLTLALRRADAMAADPATPRRGGLPDVPIQALVVAPSQELAMQIVRVAKSLLPAEVRKHAVQQVIGGANPKRQAEALAEVPGPLLVVGTPGRLAEMVRSGSLRLHRCPLMVLDEADQLLAPAFAEDINHLNEHCGKRLLPREHKPERQQQQRQQFTSAVDGTAAAADGTTTTGGIVTTTLTRAVATSNGATGGEQEEGSASPTVAVPVVAVPHQRQTVLVSATLTPSLLSRSARWCADPRFISAGAVPAVVAPEEHGAVGAGDKEGPAWGWGARGWDGPASPLAPKTRGSVGGVEGDDLMPTMPPQLVHYYLVAEPRHKVDLLRRAMHALDSQRALVFMNFQQRLQDTQHKLQARGMKAAALHGELPRLIRSNILNDFRRGRLRALVVSDVAARGIDVPQCDAVFHLELPSSAAHYAHRAGRTGRLSAALAAEAAAEAAAAADAEAAEGPAASSASTSADGFLLEQAAGTVVTVVAPHERFVVEKLAAQLGVPLLEAHVSHGHLRLGPPPAGYSFEKDVENDRTASTSGASAGRERKAGGGAEAARRDAGAEASTSGRARDAVAATGGKKGTKGTTTAAPSSQPGPVSAATTGRKGRKEDDEAEGGKYEVIVDEDDDIVLDDEDLQDEDVQYDYEILDEDLEAFKRLRPQQIRNLAAVAGSLATGGVVQLKGQRKKRIVPPGTVFAVGVGGAKADEQGQGSRGGRAKGEEKRRREDGGEEAKGRGEGGPRPRSAMIEMLRRELDELKEEKEKMGKKGGRGVRKDVW